MIFFLVSHCPACVGALNVPTSLSTTSFKNYEFFINYNYSFGSSADVKLNAHTFNLTFVRNFSKFSLISVLPFTLSRSTHHSSIDNINTLYGIDMGFRYFPVYSKYSKTRSTLSILVSYKFPIGFYSLNNENLRISEYISFGTGYAFIMNKIISYGEAIYSRALKRDHMQLDKARGILGFYYVFENFELGPILNYVYQEALSSDEISLGLSYGFSVNKLNINLNAHKSVFYKGHGVENEFSFEISLKGGF
ncbi:MAG: hypothetical protein N2504_01755 [candidate division WOR-3 bacterium]|nr:hypothetical protein [candidate division WOR-3 bacterium]MCX7947296.1 hypothetical protein [candidate division WOR-3 bacterium]MDW8150147.1 hypothetical protein [candidate division WOR-3 bacterium]